MPRTSQTRATAGPEYRLLITPRLSERTQEVTTLVVLETVKVFATFRYELTVEEHLEGKELTFAILGFRTPRLSLPAAGPARFEREYPGLRGTYTVTVKGIDGRTSTFSVKIGQKKVEVLKSPRHPFVQVLTHQESWEQHADS